MKKYLDWQIFFMKNILINKNRVLLQVVKLVIIKSYNKYMPLYFYFNIDNYIKKDILYIPE